MLSLLTLVGNVHYRFSGDLAAIFRGVAGRVRRQLLALGDLGGEFDDEFPLLFDGGQRVVPHRGPRCARSRQIKPTRVAQRVDAHRSRPRIDGMRVQYA